MTTIHKFMITATLLAAAAGCESSKKAEKTEAPAPLVAAPLTVEETAQGSVTAVVKSIDYTTRRVTLSGTDGVVMDFVAGPDVKRLNEVKVGDTVKAEYVVSLLAELRPATAEEAAHPISIVTLAGRTTQNEEPGAGAARATRVVTTVEAVDLGAMLVTLKGPFGDTIVVRARSAENVKKLHVGDTIVITYTRAVGVMVVKAPQI